MSGKHLLVSEWTMRVLLGGFFVWSGGMKLPDLSAFTESVGNFQLEWQIGSGEEARNFFDQPTDAVIAYSLPWFEIFAGLAVLSGFGKRAGLAILAVMLLSFNGALAYAWNLGIQDLACGCHGDSETPTNFPLKIASNFGLILAIVVIFGLIWFQRRLASAQELPRI